MTVDASNPPEGTVRGWLDFHAATSGGDLCLMFPDEPCEPLVPDLTWRKLRKEAKLAAERLAALGTRKGESVALMAPNGRDLAIALYGALYGGFRAVMVNLAAGRDAIAHALSHSDARLAIVSDCQLELFNSAGGGRLDRLPASDRESWHASPGSAKLSTLHACDDALLMYTSGTTGLPKGVVHTHASLLAGGWTTAVAHKLTPDDKALCVLPLCHINGLCVTVMGPLVSGGRSAICRKFSASSFWKFCEGFGVTWASVVPTIISHLLHGPCEPDGPCRSRIRFIRSASAPLPPDIQRKFEERFGIPIVETMGLTETAAQILSNPLPPGDRRIGSPGIAYGNEACVLSESLEPVGPGIEGEIAVRGPNVMRGYFKDPKATNASMTDDGWLRTGDLGRMDPDGYFYVTGRLKELIIKGGENIAPREIDEALYSVPDVVEAGCFARPSETYGETVEAAVRLSEGSRLSPEDLVKVCRGKLGDFKCPDRIHVLDELPKGPSGKIQRLRLADLTRGA